MSKNYYLYVHNTITGKTEKVEVTEEVYFVYRRTYWKIKNNNKKFFENEIQLSALIGYEKDNCEKFSEFITNSTNPYELLEKEQQIESLLSALGNLKKSERELIQALYFDEKTEREFAEQKKVSQPTIHHKKKRILKKIKKFLE